MNTPLKIIPHPLKGGTDIMASFQHDTPEQVDRLMASSQRIHFIGIGGSGMYPLVQILLSKGYHITGSDVNDGDIIHYERQQGISVALQQVPENLGDAQVVIYTAAILPGNAELGAARERGLPCLERSLLLGWVTRQFQDAVCICGTHGKTTATSMLTQVLLEAGKDPSAVIGGKLPAIHGYGCVGKSSLCVVEACEFVDTFLELSPDVAVLLNIDNDHLDYFKTMENLTASFHQFLSMAKKRVYVNGDDPNSQKALEGLSIPIDTFGLSEENRFYAKDLTPGHRSGWSFTLCKEGRELGKVRLKVPGRHNIYNALAAAAVALSYGVAPEAVCAGLEHFGGAGRRFEVLGVTPSGVTIADDYAHHPTELGATLDAAMEMGFQKVWALFQPFTYSRTQRLMEDFARVLKKADRVLLTEIMGSREVNTFGVTSQQLADRVPGALVFASFEELCDYALANAQEGDLIITLGCGDIYKAAKHMLGLGEYENR